MTAFSAWLALALVLVAAELLTGSFFFLLLGVGALGGAIAAYFGAPVAHQMAASAVCCLPALAFLAFKLKRGRAEESSDSLDIGGIVEVTQWDSPDHALVQHRGAQWVAKPTHRDAKSIGPHIIVGTQGNSLIISKI
jgi:membrane protein implicated in regulation of membrane protease activity